MIEYLNAIERLIIGVCAALLRARVVPKADLLAALEVVQTHAKLSEESEDIARGMQYVIDMLRSFPEEAPLSGLLSSIAMHAQTRKDLRAALSQWLVIAQTDEIVPELRESLRQLRVAHGAKADDDESRGDA